MGAGVGVHTAFALALRRPAKAVSAPFPTSHRTPKPRGNRNIKCAAVGATRTLARLFQSALRAIARLLHSYCTALVRLLHGSSTALPELRHNPSHARRHRAEPSEPGTDEMVPVGPISLKSPSTSQSCRGVNRSSWEVICGETGCSLPAAGVGCRRLSRLAVRGICARLTRHSKKAERTITCWPRQN